MTHLKLYAEVARYRNRQLAQDLGLLLWAFVWVRVGMHVYHLVLRLAEPGRTVERAGVGLSGTLADISSKVGDIPLVGGSLRQPFATAGEAGAALERAGLAQQEVVQDLATWLGVLLALIPISYVAYRYLPDRWRWIREAGAASMLRIDAADLHLFALRAIARQPLYELRRATPDPAAALAQGDYEPLASLELASLGLKTSSSRLRETG
jgi:hypothetical protein